jgi:integrase
VEITPLQDEQVAQFLCSTKGHPFENVYLVDLFAGIRQSGIMGLKWDDVDFEHGNITIRRQGGYCFNTSKNNKPRQIIPAKFVMDVLRIQKTPSG